ncbi:MAG: hypothetical protein DYG89_43930 [Caldilinea sp. CFX5]|nr:hypothetical protein [Caldilinea sp. CFX5]
MFTFLMIVTALVTVAFFAIVIYYVNQIMSLLYAIGYKPDSYLAKLRLGLRAIETETGHLPVQVTQLNAGLSAVAEGLQAADGHLVGTIEAVVRQKGVTS